MWLGMYFTAELIKCKRDSGRAEIFKAQDTLRRISKILLKSIDKNHISFHCTFLDDVIITAWHKCLVFLQSQKQAKLCH